MKKTNKVYILFLLISLSAVAHGQQLDFTQPGQALLTAFEKLFPYIAGLGMVWIIYRNLNSFAENDYWKPIKEGGIYVIIVIALIQLYRYIRQLSL